jgi:hypothetical protein
MPSAASAVHLRAVPTCAIDPFAERTEALPLAGVDWLIEHGFLAPGPASPLAPPRALTPRRPRREREAAGAELARRRLVSRAWMPGERRRRLRESGPLGRGLAVLERPESRLRLGRARPGEPPEEVQLYASGGRVAAGWCEGDTVHVGEPFALEALLAQLTAELSSEALGPGRDALCLWPMLYRLTTALWPSRGKRADEALSVGEVRTLLTGDGRGERAHGLLREMAAAGLVEAGRGGVVLSPAYRRWLEPVWSGHVFEIECTRLGPGGGATAAAERLLFAGPSGRRVLCEDAGSHALLADAAASGPAPAGVPEPLPDEQLMVFTRPSHRELVDLVGGLLGPGPALRAAAL